VATNGKYRVFSFAGVVIFALGVFLFGNYGCGKPPPPPPDLDSNPYIVPPILAMEASGPISVFAKFRIQEAHKDYQKAYLDLIKKINSLENNKLSEREKMKVFTDYSLAVRRYREVLKKINDYEKEGREKCFSVMRSMVSAIQIYDKRSNKKMFKFDAQKLVETGIFQEAPKCPRGGEYSIYYKDGRRFFRCSVHGTLKQN